MKKTLNFLLLPFKVQLYYEHKALGFKRKKGLQLSAEGLCKTQTNLNI